MICFSFVVGWVWFDYLLFYVGTACGLFACAGGSHWFAVILLYGELGLVLAL